MGCTNAVCGTKPSKSSAVLINRPQKQDFSLELSESEVQDARITHPPKDCILGVPFIIQELSKTLTQAQLKTSMKRKRMIKWKKMVQFGLAEDIQFKTIKVINNGPDDPIIFGKPYFSVANFKSQITSQRSA
jgi:hypothetical protein